MRRDFLCCCSVSWVLWPPERDNDRTLCNFIAEEYPRISQKDVKTARWGTHHLERAALFLQLLVFIMSCFLPAGSIFQRSVQRSAQVTKLRSLIHKHYPQCAGWGPHLMYWMLVKYCFRVFSLPYRGMFVTILTVCLTYVDNFTLSTSQWAQDVVLRAFCIWRTQTVRREVIYVSPSKKSSAKLERKYHCGYVYISKWWGTAGVGCNTDSSSAQDLSSALKLVWRIYFGLELLSPREMNSCWQLECTWCTSFGLIQHPRVQFASSETTHDMSLQVYFFTYQIYSQHAVLNGAKVVL